MEFEFTRMSPNGQIVIPAQIRKSAKFDAKDRFLVISENDTIIIKKLTRADFAKDLALLGRIAEAEEQVRKGETLTLPASMPIKEQMRKLDEYGHSLQRGVRKKKSKTR
ncbi:TPA: AbrB/MazE/SpoVT family DNA-binding domain-containing protein [Candidatus Woesearchaeota archaeon]|nr:AbrB/MazE/SpoVT family DNA-binding domain-containing protein [Candidatus Woesearchaeota archaeon]